MTRFEPYQPTLLRLIAGDALRFRPEFSGDGGRTELERAVVSLDVEPHEEADVDAALGVGAFADEDDLATAAGRRGVPGRWAEAV